MPIGKIHLKCDLYSWFNFKWYQRTNTSSFNLDKPPGFKIFCERETIHYEKLIKSVLNNISFYVQDDDGNKVHFSGETTIFTR